MSRTNKTAINTATGLICTVISSVLSFVLQAVFIRLLGLEYSGINSLFTDILKILNIAELGIENAVLFHLYHAISNKDQDEIELYLTSYRKICYLIGAVVGAVGLLFIPFLGNFVKEPPNFPEPLWSLYVIVLATSVSMHFIGYPSILFIAKQDRFISTIIQYACIFLKHGLQILVLVVFRNIYLYLLVDLGTTLLRGLIAGIVSWKKYHLSWHKKKNLTKDQRKDLTKDIGALAVFKFCRTLNVTIDTFLISKFISVATTAIYGSVTVITSALHGLLDTLNDGMIASVGDLFASGNRKRVKEVLLTSTHMVYLLYGVCTVVLVAFLGTFTTWWIGHTLPNSCIYVLLFNFYTSGHSSNVSTFRNAMGLYRKGWKRPAATALINLVVSWFLIQKIGLIGALLGTSIANISTIIWYDPLVVFKHGLQEKAWPFLGRYLIYLFFVATASVGTSFVSRLLPMSDGFISLVWHGAVYLACAAVLLLGMGAVFPEQKELFHMALQIIKRAKKKPEE